MRIHNTGFEKSLGAVLLLGLIVAGIFAFTKQTHANPSYFVANATASCTANSITSTSTLVYQTTGAATTTYCLNGNVGSSQAVDSAILLLHRVASSTVSQTKVQFEYSMNCDGSPDWYQNKLELLSGTTTPDGQFFSKSNQTTAFIWQFASTSQGGVNVLTNAATDTVAINVPMVTKCVRAVVTVPAGAQPSAIWAEFVGKREAY